MIEVDTLTVLHNKKAVQLYTKHIALFEERATKKLN